MNITIKIGREFISRRKKYKIVLDLFVAVCWVVVFFLSCDKTPVGYDELERGLSDAVFNEFRTVSRYCYGKYAPLGDANYLVLGKNSEYESRILMKFSLDDTTVNADSVVSITLVLYPRRYSNISFNVHPIQETGEWNENTATWKKSDGYVPWLTDGGDYYPTVLAHTNLTADSCIIPLPMSKLDTIINHSYGIILIPDTMNDSFAIVNSRSVNYPPRIVFKLKDSSLLSFNPTQDCHIIDTIDVDLPPTELWIGSGFPYRTMLRFNIDTIPDNITIAYAELVLPVESHYSISDTINIGIWKVLESNFTSLTLYDDNITAATQFINSTDTTIIFDIRKIVQYWNVKPDSNFGMLISVYPENNEISRIKLKTGSSAPRLKVGYILPPKGRF